MGTEALFNLNGKVALVTGGSRGIGEAIACTLARAGAQVLVTSRKPDACQQVVERILADGGKAEAMACHIGDLGQIKALFETIATRYGRLDILVNNAATNPHFGHILDTPLEAFEKTLEVNIRGYFYLSVEAGKLMRQQKQGAIVNVASVNAVVPGHFQGVYSMTKAAVVSMTKAFAKECAGLGIRVNALLPGLTDTRFASTLINNEAILRKALEHVPMNRAAKPEEMAGAVLYLVSDAASYTTGACLNVDGGYLTV